MIAESVISASNGRSRNHRSIVQRCLWIAIVRPIMS